VRARELLAESAGLGVDHEIDVALAVERDVLAAVARADRETHAREQSAQELRIWGGVLDELEPVRSHRVVEKVCHRRNYASIRGPSQASRTRLGGKCIIRAARHLPGPQTREC
jgi:hypothetical protein